VQRAIDNMVHQEKHLCAETTWECLKASESAQSTRAPRVSQDTLNDRCSGHLLWECPQSVSECSQSYSNLMFCALNHSE
jgi:hypothetical protein